MRKLFAHTVIAVAALAGLSTAAQARLLVTIKDNTTATTSTCDSGLAQSGSNCVGYSAYAIGANDLTFSASGFTAVGNFSFSNSSFSGATTPFLPVTSGVAVNNLKLFANLANSSLTITTTAFDFSLPVGQIKNLSGSSSQNGYSAQGDGSTQDYGFFIDGANGTSQANGVTCAASPLLVSNGGCNTSGVFDIGAPGTQLFALTTVQNLFIKASNIIIQDSATLNISVPEPTSLALVGLALVGAGYASRRRFKA